MRLLLGSFSEYKKADLLNQLSLLKPCQVKGWNKNSAEL